MEKENEIELGEWIENIGSSGLWLPKTQGEVIMGKIVEIREGIYGMQILIKNDKDEIQTTPSHKALQARLGGVQVNDFIKISYEGTDLPKVKGQQPTRLYKVFVKRIPELSIR